MAKAVGEGEEEAVVGGAFEVEGSVGFEVETATDEGEGDVV